MITAYTDYINVIVDSNEKVNEIRQIFEQLEAVSGARLNLPRTVGMQIGKFSAPPWLSIKKVIKILGIFFESWNDTINKARGFLFMHMGRAV
jgi:hypothetical protein